MSIPAPSAPPRRLRHAALGAAAVTALLLTVLPVGSTAAQSHGSETNGTISLEFDGGSAAEYVQRVRRAAGVVNIITLQEEALASVRMPAVELQRVAVEDALGVLEHIDLDRNQRPVHIEVTARRAQGNAAPVYTVRTHISSGAGPAARSMIWTLEGLLDERVKAEDVLTAIETTLELFGDAFADAEIRYHAETTLLIVRAHPEQISSIDAVLDALREAQHTRIDEQQRSRRERGAAAEITDLREQLAAATRNLEAAARDANEWRTRGQLYLGEIDSKQRELEKLSVTMKEALSERDSTIATMRSELAQLRRRAGGENDR